MIYLLDAEESFASDLRITGPTVEQVLTGYLGYSQGHPLKVFLSIPPHEADVLIYNLIKPACYDRNRWGTTNSNSQCKIISDPHDEYRIIDQKKYHRFQIVLKSHIKSFTSKFRTEDVCQAIKKAGIPLIVFLNPEHVKHASYQFLDWLDLDIRCSITESNKYFVPQELSGLFNRKDLEVIFKSIKDPIRVKVDYISPKATPLKLLVNGVDDNLCSFIPYGKGCILLSPVFQDQAAAARLLSGIVPKMLSEYNQRISSTSKEAILKARFLNQTASINNTFDYINSNRIEELKRISHQKFDLKKLIKLCEELNIAHRNKCHYSIGMLVRAIMDHAPPIFNCDKFSEVASNYSGSRSFREHMKNLDMSLRKIADGFLHTHIRNLESLPNEHQVNFSPALDELLAEIVRVLSIKL